MNLRAWVLWPNMRMSWNLATTDREIADLALHEMYWFYSCDLAHIFLEIEPASCYTQAVQRPVSVLCVAWSAFKAFFKVFVFWEFVYFDFGQIWNLHAEKSAKFWGQMPNFLLFCACSVRIRQFSVTISAQKCSFGPLLGQKNAKQSNLRPNLPTNQTRFGKRPGHRHEVLREKCILFESSKEIPTVSSWRTLASQDITGDYFAMSDRKRKARFPEATSWNNVEVASLSPAEVACCFLTWVL